MILLDTNVLSALTDRSPEPSVVGWLDRQPRLSIWTTAVTVFELKLGLLLLPIGKRRTNLTAAIDVVLHKKIEGRIAVLDGTSAERTAELMAARRAKGKLVDFRDSMIAGIAMASHATIATRNVTDFEDLPVRVVNPWNA